jgi:hypothetical protein
VQEAGGEVGIIHNSKLQKGIIRKQGVMFKVRLERDRIDNISKSEEETQEDMPSATSVIWAWFTFKRGCKELCLVV